MTKDSSFFLIQELFAMATDVSNSAFLELRYGILEEEVLMLNLVFFSPELRYASKSLSWKESFLPVEHLNFLTIISISVRARSLKVSVGGRLWR